MQCAEHYCNSGSPVCGHILSSNLSGSQIFTVPRSGNYTVTIAGASGGHGVCSNYSGLGVIVNGTVPLRRGERLRILVGQQGTSACDTQNADICRMSNDSEACENLWNNEYFNMAEDYYYYDGGGGGGGASLLEFDRESVSPTVIAPGGGGAAALYNITNFLSSLNMTYNDSDDLEALYRNYTYGHAFETSSEEADGTNGVRNYIPSAGPGAGYFVASTNLLVTFALSTVGHGSLDCTENSVTPIQSLFPNTDGGFGGGGGGCNGGGGGGGYTGGSIIEDGAAIPGEGGYSWPDPPWPLVGYNDGDGYVELFPESCGCTYNCTIYNQSSFECSCPSNTVLALNGFDCYKEGYVHVIATYIADKPIKV